MLKTARMMQSQLRVPPSRIFNFDEIRIYSSPQDLHSHTLEFVSVRDPLAMKVANPKEAYTGIIMVNGDGSLLQVFLVTTKALPPDSVIHTETIEDRRWENGQVKVGQVPIQFALIHGIVVIKAAPGMKAWCSSMITEAFLRVSLFHIKESAILQVSGFKFLPLFVICSSEIKARSRFIRFIFAHL